jgi:excisionase family DNA binding protein
MSREPECATLSVEATAKRIGVSRKTLYELWEKGEGPPWLRAGGRRLIRVDALEAWLRNREQTR